MQESAMLIASMRVVDHKDGERIVWLCSSCIPFSYLFEIGLWLGCVRTVQLGNQSWSITDGSKIGEAVGSAAIVASRLCKKRLPNNSSIFSMEARRIQLELNMVHQSTGSQLLFLSDSLSCQQSLKNRDLSRTFISEILCLVHDLLSGGTSVVFMWVPSHVGLAEHGGG